MASLKKMTLSTCYLVEDAERGEINAVSMKAVANSGSAPPHSDNLDGEEVLSAEPFTPLLSSNQYTVRKMAAQAMMDVALMMANISQMRTLLSGGSENISYFPFLMALVAFSLASQVVFGILIFVIWVRESAAHQRDEFERSMREKEKEKEKEFRSAATSGSNSSDSMARMRQSMLRQKEHYERDLLTNKLNHGTMVLVFLITVANMFITGFGIETPNEWGDPAGRNAT